MENLAWYKNKNLPNRYDLEGLIMFDNQMVEPQRIELWSRETEGVLSTCLVDFYCREQQGHQHPRLFLSH
jgi:hypothetical protein